MIRSRHRPGADVDLEGRDSEPSAKPDNIAFLYSWDWSHEFRDYENGCVPAHRLFGAGQLGAFGMNALHWSWKSVPRAFRNRKLWQLWQGLWVVLAQRNISVVVATTEVSALVPLLFRRLGVLRVPVITASVAILRSSWAHGVRAWVLGRSDLVLVYASAQVRETAKCLGLPVCRVRFVPFGVDTDFFAPSPVPGLGPVPDILSVGTNEGKDYPTLLAALHRGQHCLIVTDGKNAGIVRRSATNGLVKLKHDIGISDLRELYARAGRCVIPLRETRYSSGQTVLLEMMATGVKPVVSDVSGIRDYVRDGETAELVPPGDPSALAAVLAQPSLPDPAIHDHVRENFNSMRFSRDLATACRDVRAGTLLGKGRGRVKQHGSLAGAVREGAT